MSFESDYKELLRYATFKVNSLQLNVLPEDLINDTYIKLFDKKYGLELYKKEINNLSLIEKHNSTNHISWGEKGSTLGNFKGDFTCIKCKEVKPSSEFRVELRKCGKKQLRTACKECESKIRSTYKYKYDLTYYNKIKVTTKYKRQNRHRVKKYVEKNRDNWNIYLRERYKNDSLNLSDSYVIKRLKSLKYSVEDIKQNPNLITEYRQRIIKKRVKKVGKLKIVN